MSKVQDCRLTTVGELFFDFDLGGCNSITLGYLFLWNHALFSPHISSRMSLVSSNKKSSDLIKIIFIVLIRVRK